MDARQVDAIVFDMDGTLFDSRTVVPDSYIASIRALGGPRYEREDIVEAYSLGPPEVILTRLLGRPSTLDDLDDYHGRLARAAHEVRVYPGIRDALAALSHRVPLAVFTGASRRACAILLESTSLQSRFAAVVGGDEVPRPKPHPDGILLACERLDVDVSRSAYVGDSPDDLEAARRSGAAAVAAGWGHLFRRGLPADLIADQPWSLVNLIGRAVG